MWRDQDVKSPSIPTLGQNYLLSLKNKHTYPIVQSLWFMLIPSFSLPSNKWKLTLKIVKIAAFIVYMFYHQKGKDRQWEAYITLYILYNLVFVVIYNQFFSQEYSFKNGMPWVDKIKIHSRVGENKMQKFEQSLHVTVIML